MKQASAVRCTTSSNDAAILVAGGDVEKAELVGAGGVIGDGAFDRIAGVAQIDEIDALDDAAVLDVEAGNDAAFKHQALAARRARRGSSASACRRIEPAVIERAAGDRAGELGAIGLRAAARHRRARRDRRRRSPGSTMASASASVASILRPFSTPSRAMSV